MSSSEPSTTNVNLRKTLPKKKSLISTDHGDNSSGQPKCASSSGQSHRTLRFHCSIPQIFLLPRSFLLDGLFNVGIGIIQKKGMGGDYTDSSFCTTLRIISTKKPAPSIFERKPSRYGKATAGHILGCIYLVLSHQASMKKKEHLPPSKTSSTAAKKKAAFLVTGQETRLSSLSLRSFHPPPLPISPSLARSLWPNDTVSRQWQSWSILLGYK